jgi:DNA-binding NarL/FixJ family response regulator
MRPVECVGIINTMAVMDHPVNQAKCQERLGALVERKLSLTRREREVLCLLADGLTTKAIAIKLHVMVLDNYGTHKIRK